MSLHASFEIRKASLGVPVDGRVRFDKFTAAIIRAQFDQPLFVNGTQMKQLAYELSHQDAEDKKNRHMRGLTRLVCSDGSVFESHPPLNNTDSAGTDRYLPVVPSHMMPLHEVPPALHDLVSLFDIDVDLPDSDEHVSLLILSYESQVSHTGMDNPRHVLEAHGRRSFVNLPPGELPNCHVHFLSEENQTYHSTGLLSNYDFEEVPQHSLRLNTRPKQTCRDTHSLIDAIHHMAYRAADYVGAIKHQTRTKEIEHHEHLASTHDYWMKIQAEAANTHHLSPVNSSTDEQKAKPLVASCDAATGLCREAPSDFYFHMHPFAQHALLAPRGLSHTEHQPPPVEGAVEFFEMDIGSTATAMSGTRGAMHMQACLALDQQQRIAEDIAMQVRSTFIGAVIKACTEPVCAMVIPALCCLLLLIIAIPLAMLIVIILEPYIEPIFKKLEEGTQYMTPAQAMMRAVSPIYWSMWGLKKKRWTKMSQMLGTGIMTQFMAEGADGGGGWGELVMICYGMILQNISGLYQNIEFKMAVMIPRFVVQVVSLMVPMGIGNFIVGRLASKIVRASVSAITHNVVHNSNYALTHSLTQSVTQSVTEAMHRQEKHYYYCLYCYYQGKYCSFCSTYNSYASAGHNLNELTYYPEPGVKK